MFEHETHQLLKELIWLQKTANRTLERIERTLTPKFPTAFTPIQQENPMIVIDPGATGAVFATTTLPAGSTLPSPPSWTVDSTIITLVPQTADKTGLSIGVNIAATATVGEVFNLTVTGTNAAGVSLTQTNPFTVGAAPVIDATSFGPIVQTA